RPAVVDDHCEALGLERAVHGSPQGRLQLEVAQTPPAERKRERQDLDRKTAAAAESVDELLGGHEDDLTPRGSRDDALAHQGGAVALDEVEVGVDLIGTVDGEVD